MKRPSIHTERRAGLDVKMTPMIDVVFLLLVFFVWTASFQVVEYALQSRVSEATAPAAASDNEPLPEDIDFDEVVLRIAWTDAGPTWLLNEIPVESLSEVRTRLQTIHNINPAAPIIIHPDAVTPLGHVIDVYDLSRLVGFEKVNLAADETSPHQPDQPNNAP